MPLPRVHAGLKKNKGDNCDNTCLGAIHIASSMDSSTDSSKQSTGNTNVPAETNNTHSSHLSASNDTNQDLRSSLDSFSCNTQLSCVASTPKDCATNVPKHQHKMRKNLSLDFNDAVESTQVSRACHDSAHAPKSKQSWLLRLFESKLFDMSLAITYLFNSKEKGVQVYIGTYILGCIYRSIQFGFLGHFKCEQEITNGEGTLYLVFSYLI